MSRYTAAINNSNVGIIQQRINSKKGSYPVFGTSTTADHIVTDNDHFPYTRFYRGMYDSVVPIVVEREAGARIVNNRCYAPNSSCKGENPINISHCWETACSTVYPCKPEVLDKYADRDALLVELNKDCINQYR